MFVPTSGNKMASLGLLRFSLAAFFFTLTESQASNQLFTCSEYTLRLDFPDGYNKFQPSERIDFMSGEPASVNVTLFVDQVKEIYDHTHSVELLMTVRFNWFDERILNPHDSCIGLIEADDFERMWKPAVTFANADSVSSRPSLNADVANVIYAAGGQFWWDQMISVQFFCDMDFSRYPLDTQLCEFRMVSASLPDILLRFNNTDKALGVIPPPNQSENELAYDVSYAIMAVEDSQSRYKDDEFFLMSAAGFNMILKRRTLPYMLNIYIPTGGLVIISFASYLIPPESYPGRMGLLVTIFLVLTNIGTGTRAKSPSSGTLTVVDQWLLVCNCFIAVALLEYAFVLFTIRRQHDKDKMTEGKPPSARRLSYQMSSREWRWLNTIDRVTFFISPIVFLIFVIVYAVTV